MESLKNKLKKKPIAKKEDVFVIFPSSEKLKSIVESIDNPVPENVSVTESETITKPKSASRSETMSTRPEERQVYPSVVIVDKTDQPFDDTDFLSSVTSKKKTKVISNPNISLISATKASSKTMSKNDQEEEFEFVPKSSISATKTTSKTKDKSASATATISKGKSDKGKTTKKLKKTLNIPSFVIEEDENEGETSMQQQPQEVEIIQPDIVPTELEITKAPSVKRTYTQKETGVVDMGTAPLVQIGDTPIEQRIFSKKDFIDIKVSSYFQNNREIFVNFIDGVFKPYKDNLIDDTNNISCEDLGNADEEMSLLTHQKIVRDYINLYTPYRGLLLYHGLGSGKTCSSIAIAEGFQSNKQVIIMTPAYLRMNYIQEIKKCGNVLFRKNQFWEWVDLRTNENALNTLSAVLGLPREYIRKQKGAWLVDFTKPSNFEGLTNKEKNRVDAQLDEMIQNKYKFINYNGLTKKKFKTLTNNYKTNIFDNSVIIIDEAHNLISRIVNKINKLSSKTTGSDNKFPDILALKIYELLLRAENSRVVLLTGTPLVNYPNELGILFNILRGYIKTWKFTLRFDDDKRVNIESLKEIFNRDRTHDYIDYLASNKTLTITRNPFGFDNKVTANSGYKGVSRNEGEPTSDAEFVHKVVNLLKKNNITAVELASEFRVYTALPDRLTEFAEQFVNEENGSVKNIEKFKRRIMGLPSYFRSAQEELLPMYDKIKDYHVIKIPMSDYQFRIYESARVEERQSEKPSTGKKSIDINGLFIDPSSTYRIFSRLFCNFVMPQPPGRPTPKIFAMKQLLNSMLEMLANEPKEKRDELLDKLNKKLDSKKRSGGGSNMDMDMDMDMDDEQIQYGGLEIEGEKTGVGEKTKKGETKTKQKKLTETERDKAENAIIDLAVMYPNLSLKDILDYLYKNKNKSLDDISIGLEQLQKDSSGQAGQEEAENLEMEYEQETDDVLNGIGDATYKKSLRDAYEFLKDHSEEYLSPEGLDIYGRKYLAVLENITNEENQGLHLVYSQFRTMEGIGILMLVLEQNGFSQFKIKRVGTDWDLDFPVEKLGSPMFGLYTGTEEDDEREIIRNIYNGDWKDLPPTIKQKISAVSKNNNLGEIIKVLMITAAGSEGINLRNTRFVHLMEPYWHPVRTEQVVGRARRICSHKNLPKEFQNVQVFLYLMTFTQEQLKSDIAAELRVKDLSKRAPFTPLTSDEKLFEISNIKEELGGQLLKAIKEASIDCSIHVKSAAKEKLTCLSFGKPGVNSFSYNPNYLQDENDNISTLNKTKITWRGKELTFNGKKMIYREDTKEVFDYDSYINAIETPGIIPVLIGKLQKSPEGKYKLVPS